MTTATSTRRVSLPAALLHSLLAAALAGRTPADAANLLRQAGYDAGGELYGMLQDDLAEAGASGSSLSALPISAFWERFTALWQALGWGSLQYRPLHAAVADLTSEDWVEAETGAQLGCHLTTGLFAELLSRVAGADVAVLEVECRSRGAAACHFLIGGAEVLTTLHAARRTGQSLDEALQQLG